MSEEKKLFNFDNIDISYIQSDNDNIIKDSTNSMSKTESDNIMFIPLTGNDNVFIPTKEVRSKKNQAIPIPVVIFNAVSMGLDTYTAASCAGVNRSSIDRWLKEDPTLESRFREARCRGIKHVVGKLIENINNNDERAIEFFLKNRSEEFADNKTSQNIPEDLLQKVIDLILSCNSLLPIKSNIQHVPATFTTSTT